MQMRGAEDSLPLKSSHGLRTLQLGSMASLFNACQICLHGPVLGRDTERPNS